jgi:ketosteroid isomerase-like protein
MFAKIRNALLATIVCTFATAIQPASASELDSFKAAIRAKYDIKEAAFRAHDPMPIAMEFYTEDVISVGIGEAYMVGRAQLLEEYKKHMADPVRIESVHTYVNGNSGWDFTNFYVMPVDPAAKPFSLKILFLWEKRNGEWWCVGDMFMEGEIKSAAKTSTP